MLDNVNLQDTMLDALKERVSSIASVIVNISQEGYIPNKHKYTKIALSLAMFRVIDNNISLTEAQRNNINSLYNKIINM